MTSRFYFDLTNGLSTLRQKEGVAADDLDEAIKNAWELLGKTQSGDDLSNGFDGRVLIVSDAKGTPLMRLWVVPPASSSLTARRAVVRRPL